MSSKFNNHIKAILLFHIISNSDIGYQTSNQVDDKAKEEWRKLDFIALRRQ